jgi:hypothetical protein
VRPEDGKEGGSRVEVDGVVKDNIIFKTQCYCTLRPSRGCGRRKSEECRQSGRREGELKRKTEIAKRALQREARK